MFDHKFKLNYLINLTYELKSTITLSNLLIQCWLHIPSRLESSLSVYEILFIDATVTLCTYSSSASMFSVTSSISTKLSFMDHIIFERRNFKRTSFGQHYAQNVCTYRQWWPSWRVSWCRTRRALVCMTLPKQDPLVCIPWSSPRPNPTRRKENLGGSNFKCKQQG